MGFWPGYTLGGKRDLHFLQPHERHELEDRRCAQIGNAFHTGVTAWLVGQGLHSAGLLPQAPTPKAIQETFYKYAAKCKEYMLDQTRLDRDIPAM